MKFPASPLALALLGACHVPTDPFADASGEAADGGHEDEAIDPEPERLPDLEGDPDEESESGGVGYERVTAWLLEPGGDLLVEATVGSAVLEHFPSADHYEMRIANEKLLVSLVDSDERALHAFRADVFDTQSFVSASFSVSVAFGGNSDLSDLLCAAAACWVPPCFCDFPWPMDGRGPAVFEVARDPTGVHAKLRKDGFEADLTFTPEGERILDPVTLPAELVGELDRFMTVHADALEIFDEVELMSEAGTIPWTMGCALGEMAPDYVAAAMHAGIWCLVEPACPEPPTDFATCSR